MDTIEHINDIERKNGATMSDDELQQIKERESKATPGPWYYNSYNAVQSHYLGKLYKQLAKEMEERKWPIVEKHDDLWEQFYDVEPEVCHVKAHHGDTAVRQRALDAEFIAHAREDIPKLLETIIELRNAIETHRSQKADDRCIEDDDKLYEVLGDGIKCDRCVGSKMEMLMNCHKFIEKRCEEGGWKTYQELEKKLDLCRDTIENILQYHAIQVNEIEDEVLVSQIKECLEK